MSSKYKTIFEYMKARKIIKVWGNITYTSEKTMRFQVYGRVEILKPYFTQILDLACYTAQCKMKWSKFFSTEN